MNSPATVGRNQSQRQIAGECSELSSQREVSKSTELARRYEREIFETSGSTCIVGHVSVSFQASCRDLASDIFLLRSRDFTATVCTVN
jgi:hypothetical protein